jgi:hypothetical protein
MIEFKTHMSLLSRTLIGLTLIIWTQLSINSAQANCIPYSPKTLKNMNSSTEPLIINESLIIADIKKAYKAIDLQGDDPRAVVVQFGTIDTTSLIENEVKPFNPDVQSIVAYDNVVDFRFRPHSLISLPALQKAFGNYRISPLIVSHNGFVIIRMIRFSVELHGRIAKISVRYESPDLTAEKIEITEISVVI